MKVEIKHHYGWRMYDVPAETLAQAAYLAIRQTREFLTDDNHTHEAKVSTTTWEGKQVEYLSCWIMRNEKSTPYSGPSWAETQYWIAVQYRAPAATAVMVIGVDMAKDSDESVLVEVDAGKYTVIATSGRRAGKRTTAKKALVKATTENPELVVVNGSADGIIIEKPVKGEVSRVAE